MPTGIPSGVKTKQAPVVVIPVLPWVARYLEAVYPDGLRLNSTDPVGVFIAQLLRYPRKKEWLDQFLDRYSAGFTVGLPVGSLSRKYHAGNHSVLAVRFSAFMEAKIKAEMYDFVDARRELAGWQKAAAIREFLTKYGISEEEWPYSTALKAYQRYEDRKQNKRQTLPGAGKQIAKVAGIKKRAVCPARQEV